MTPSSRRFPVATSACPRCGRVSAAPFATGGVCLRCAGARVLAMESGEAPSGDPEAAREPLAADDRDGLPDRIGAFEIIEELGRGGMARVFAARQIGLGRIVALKAIPAGRNTADLELRFLREAQTVARLRHPHIIGIHESGRANGHVYFSMDYVEGGDLARRLREGGLTPRAVAELLLKVTGALAYTHGEGVLHRDLKPSNILLDGGEPRLADFGLAAQLEAGGDLTAATGVLGTPHYVAPEALRGGSAALTVASDLYALGVVLFEMLTGRTPFAGASPAELAAIVETSEVPSLRLLAPAVPRDLETICLKCLERDPARRYTSAAAFAEDLRRFLAGETIVARPPGRFERLVKYARRHRVGFIAASVVAAVLIGASAVSSWLAVRARRAEATAASDNAVSREVVSFLRNDLLAQAAPDEQPNRDIPLRTVLDRAAKKLDGHFADQPLVEAALRETLAATYSSLGEYATEQRQLERALAVRRKLTGPEDPATLQLLDHLGVNLALQGKLKAADPIAHQAVRLSERVLGPSDPATLHAMNDLIYVCKAQGRIAEAEAVARSTLDRARAALGPDHPETRDAMNNLASVLFTERKLPESETWNVQALAAEERVLGPEHPDTLTVMSNLASVYWAEDKLAEAEKLNVKILAIRRRLLGPEHPETLRSMHNLATTLDDEGKGGEAVALLEQVLTIRRRVQGPDHADSISTAMSLSAMYLEQGRLDEAMALAEPALATARRVLGPRHFLTLAAMFNVGRIEVAKGRLAEAEALLDEAWRTRAQVSGPENSQTLLVADALGNTLVRERKYEEARRVLELCLAARTKAAPTHWRTLVTRSELGGALAGLLRFAEAEPMVVKSYEALEKLASTIPIRSRVVVAAAGKRVVQFYASAGNPARAQEWRERIARAQAKN